MTSSEQIRNNLLRYLHSVETLTNKQIRILRTVLLDSVKDIDTQIELMNLKGAKVNTIGRDRLVELRSEIRRIINLTNATMSNQLEEFLRTQGFETLDNLTEYIRGAIPDDIRYVFNTVPIEQVATFINAPTGGMLWRERMLQRYGEVVNLMDNVIARGVIQGLSTYQISKLMKEAIGREWKRGAWEQIVRTEVIRVSNAIALEVFNRNSDLVKGVEWVATLDFKICKVCAALDGRTWKLGEFNIHIPAHTNCFVNPDTPILTYNGWVSIDQIIDGDLVLTHTGRYKKVMQVITSEVYNPEIVCLKFTICGIIQEISITSDHPLLICGEWKSAKDIRFGDLLTYYFRYGDCFVEIPIDKLEIKKMNGLTKLYNFSVKDDESYIANGVVVHNCRCILIPVLKSWEEMGLDAKYVTPETRSSMNGQVPATTNYADWFAQQSSSFQRNWLGRNRYKDYIEGRLKIDDFPTLANYLNKLDAEKPLRLGK